jgi:hypothetical protein
MTAAAAFVALCLASYAVISLVVAKREKRKRQREFLENLTALIVNRR